MRRNYLVIADADTVLGFMCAGVHGVAVDNSQAALDALRQAQKDGIGVVIMTEEIADMVRAAVDEIRFDEALPLVVEVAGPRGPIPGRRSRADMIRQAIGVKV